MEQAPDQRLATAIATGRISDRGGADGQQHQSFTLVSPTASEDGVEAEQGAELGSADGHDPQGHAVHSGRTGGATLSLGCPTGHSLVTQWSGFWAGPSEMRKYTRPTREMMLRNQSEMLTCDCSVVEFTAR